MRRLEPKKAVGLRRCDCGMYAEKFHATCPACGRDFAVMLTEDCPTCDGGMREGEEGCESCLGLQSLADRPRSITAV